MGRDAGHVLLVHARRDLGKLLSQGVPQASSVHLPLILQLGLKLSVAAGLEDASEVASTADQVRYAFVL